jgi:hypothetical protein
MKLDVSEIRDIHGNVLLQRTVTRGLKAFHQGRDTTWDSQADCPPPY